MSKTFVTGEVLTASDVNTFLVSKGLGSNVVQTVKTDTFTTSSTSLVNVTGLSVTITPTATSSKVLVSFSAVQNTTSNNSSDFQLVRGSTNIGVSTGASTSNATTVDGSATNAARTVAIGQQFLDSPATDTAVTYKVQMRVSAGSASVGGDAARRGISTITVIEVAA